MAVVVVCFYLEFIRRAPDVISFPEPERLLKENMRLSYFRMGSLKSDDGYDNDDATRK